MRSFCKKKHHWLLLFFVFQILSNLFLPAYASQEQDSVLVLKPFGAQYNEIFLGVFDGLSDEFLVVHEKLISKDFSGESLLQYIDQYKPSLVVVMGDAAAKVYHDYQISSASKQTPPSVILAASRINRYMKNMKNVIGVFYEVPAVIGLLNARLVTKKSIRKVGVVHLDSMKDYMALNQRFCEKENIELISISIPDDEKRIEKAVKRSLKKLVSQGVDALWVVNDRVLLGGEVLKEGWVPVTIDFDKPIIVNSESLASTRLNFGTFAVFPDHYGLGEQAASLILDVMYDGWALEKTTIELPVSVKKLLNVRLSKKRKIAINEDNLNILDHVILEHVLKK